MNPDRKTTILLADDDPRVCRSLRMLLRHRPGVDVAAEDGSGSDVVGKAKIGRPDIILLDWELISSSPAQVLSALYSLDMRPIVIVLSVQPEHEQQALAAGADAFVSKIDPPEKLLEAVDAFLRAPGQG